MCLTIVCALFRQTTYALLLFPYLVLVPPQLRLYLTHAKPTGYDRAGRLCAALSAADKVRCMRRGVGRGVGRGSGV